MTTDEILDAVTGYADGYAQVLSKTQMDAEALDELLLNNNIEKCSNCGLFTDSCFLIDDGDEPDGYCDNCRSTDKPRGD
jgi:hypothetical protein